MKFDSKLHSINQKYFRYITSFLSAAVGMYIILSLRGMIGAGRYSIIAGDSLHNYIPAIKNLMRDVLAGNKLSYTWNMCMGINTSLYYSYYAINPFNFFYLLDGIVDDNAITAFIIIVKTGLAAMCFNRFAENVIKLCDLRAVTVSVFYSLCSFQVISNIINIIWLDALWVLPLVIVSMNKLFDEGKYVELTFWYVYIFITQFYMGYMIGLFSLIYFLIRFWINHNNRKTGILICKKFFKSVLIAIGLTAFLWVPTISFIRDNTPSDATVFAAINTDIIDIYRQMFWKEQGGLEAAVPNIYSGVLTVILIPAFFLTKNVKKSIKTLYGSLFVLLLASCISPVAYAIWHGFDAPDGWTFRFAYVISFTICTMSAYAIRNIEKRELLYVLITAVFEVLIYFGILRYRFRDFDLTVFIVNLVIFAVWLAVLLAYKTRFHKLVSAIMVILCLGEIIFAYKDIPATDLLKSEYLIWNLTEKETVDELNKDEGFYRVNYLNDYGMCSGAQYGYKSMSYFSSVENPNVRKCMAGLGLYTSPRLMLNYGLTPVTKMLFDVKYDIIGVALTPKVKLEEMYSDIIENENILGVGYIVDKKILDYSSDKYIDAFENNNQMISCMTGYEIRPFRHLSYDDINIEENGVMLRKIGNEFQIMTDPPEDRDAMANLGITAHSNRTEDVYAYVANGFSGSLNETFYLEGGYENSVREDGKLSVSYIKQLDNDNGISRLRIIPKKSITNQRIKDIFLAVLDKEELHRAYNVLKENQFCVEKYTNGSIRGNVRKERDDGVLFLSVPYDKGWHGKVNGHEIELIPVLDGAFMAIDLPGTGQFYVELEFEAIGGRLGRSISLIVALGTAIYLIRKDTFLRKIKIDAKKFIKN